MTRTLYTDAAEKGSPAMLELAKRFPKNETNPVLVLNMNYPGNSDFADFADDDHRIFSTKGATYRSPEHRPGGNR